MAVTSITAALNVLHQLSTENGITVEQTGGTIQGWEKLRTSEQLTATEKLEANSAKPLIAEIYAADPTAELDPAEIAARVGLPNKQGSRSFVRHQLRQLRLTYQNGSSAAAAD